LRLWIRYGTTLRTKLIVLVLVIAAVVFGALYSFSLVSLRRSISSIYEQRARSVAAVVSKSIQEKDYVLYYSEELDLDIARLLERYESVVGIRIVGAGARGYLVVASTDPTDVGHLVSDEERERFDLLSEIEVSKVRHAGISVLRAYHPLYLGADLDGVVVVDMSREQQIRDITRLSLLFGMASLGGFFLLGGALYGAMLWVVTRPVDRLAGATDAVAQRNYDVEVHLSTPRIPGMPVKDEVSRLISGFNLMTKVIHSHEKELMKLVVLDELTGAYTVDHLRSELDRELSKTRRYKHPTSVILVDVAGLAALQKTQQGEPLIRTANFLVENLRNVDVLFRVGPYRFASLLPETPPAGAEIAAQRLRSLATDVTSHFDPRLSLSVIALGWEDEGTPEIDEILARIVGEYGDLGE